MDLEQFLGNNMGDDLTLHSDGCEKDKDIKYPEFLVSFLETIWGVMT